MLSHYSITYLIRNTGPQVYLV